MGLETIELPMKVFKSLSNYSHTIPTGSYIGKRWRAQVPPQGAICDGITVPGGSWMMGEFVESELEGQVGIKWRLIIGPSWNDLLYDDKKRDLEHADKNGIIGETDNSNWGEMYECTDCSRRIRGEFDCLKHSQQTGHLQYSSEVNSCIYSPYKDETWGG